MEEAMNLQQLTAYCDGAVTSQKLNALRLKQPKTRLVLTGASLIGWNLSGADLSGADLNGAFLSGALLAGALLAGADLNGAFLSGADLNGADLSGADLNGARLAGALLAGANLSGANLNDADLNDADLMDCIGVTALQFMETKGLRSVLNPPPAVMAAWIQQMAIQDRLFASKRHNELLTLLQQVGG